MRIAPYPAYKPSGVEWLGENARALGNTAVEGSCHNCRRAVAAFELGY